MVWQSHKATKSLKTTYFIYLEDLAQTALYNAQILIENKRYRLNDVLEVTEDIIDILKEMQDSTHD